MQENGPPPFALTPAAWLWNKKFVQFFDFRYR